jgi:hypothetical protein
LEGRDSIIAKFEQFRGFFGLFDGLELGNVQRHLAVHVPEEIEKYLPHVYDVWRHITFRQPRNTRNHRYRNSSTPPNASAFG